MIHWLLLYNFTFTDTTTTNNSYNNNNTNNDINHDIVWSVQFDKQFGINEDRLENKRLDISVHLNISSFERMVSMVSVIRRQSYKRNLALKKAKLVLNSLTPQFRS